MVSAEADACVAVRKPGWSGDMLTIIRRFASSESGATAVEYALMCMCIVIAIIASIATLGTQVNNMYGEIPGYLK